MTDLTPAALSDLERLAKAATSGPWHEHLSRTRISVRASNGNIAFMTISDISARRSEGHSNAAYIAALSPETILALIAMVRGK